VNRTTVNARRMATDTKKIIKSGSGFRQRVYFGKNFNAAVRLLTVLLCACCAASGLVAQQKPVLRVETLGQYGRIYKHTPNFLPSIDGPSVGGEIGLVLQTTGNRAWHKPYGYPAYGIAASVVRYNNDSVLGYGVGLLPQVFIPVFKREAFQVDFNIGTGVAFLTKHYDVIKNPTNNVIATGVNNITSFGFRARYKLSERWHVLGGVSFTHYSTGDARLPNLGINVPALKLGAAYTFHPVPTDEIFSPDPPGRRKGLVYKARFSIARFEAAQRNGPVFTQYDVETGVLKYLGNWNKLSLTVNGLYNSYAYFQMFTQERNRGEQLKRSFGLTTILEDEVLMGRVGLTGAVGVVLYQPVSGGKYYEQLGVQYHFVNFKSDYTRNLYAGVYLKTHWANAEHVKVGIGFEW
jgi:hypothetical protein